MIARLVAFALRQRFITLALVVSFCRLPIEEYPDAKQDKWPPDWAARPEIR